ncbi:unnamed protein product [Sphagnum jensenii]|uniref:Tify domain-containing protein n=1 Tax=Sphagnum jensenii TaxID=128206 RepID=A0ABP1AZY1_9BRYO
MKKMSNMSDNGEMAKDFMGLGDTSSRETEAVIVEIERSSCNGAAASLGGLENNLIEKGGRRGGEGTARAATATKPSEELAATDIQQLSREDCWRLILEAGMQWPSCDTAFRLQSQQDGLLTKASKNAGTRLEQQGVFLLPVMAADQVVNKAQEGSSMETIQEVQNQITNKTSRMLANRALDELARTPSRPPPQHASILPHAVPSSHATPVSIKRETSNWTQQQTTGAVVAAAAAAALEPPMPSLPFTASVPDPSSRQRRFWQTNPSTEQTAQLTIFYAGTVNVFDDVTAEKANLIMLLAASGASLTSVLAKFLSSQVGSMAAPSILNATTTTARSSVQTSPANPPPASVLPTTSIAAAAPEVAPLLASSQAQQQHFSLLPKLPLPHARKSSLARFFDLRQRQKRARMTSQNALTSKKLVDCSHLPSDSASSFPKSDEHAPVLSLELSQPSSPTTTSQVINGKDAGAAISERAPVEQQKVETAAANDEALPMETEAIAVVSS